MASLDWNSIGALFGALTGLVGAVTGVIALRRADQLKALDLRIQLRQAENIFHSDLEALLALMQRAKKSREHVNSATGAYLSGAMKKWHSAFEVDNAEAQLLGRTLSFSNAKLPNDELETKLIELHALQLKVMRLKEKYDLSYSQDDQKRMQIWTEQQDRINRELSKSK